MLRIKGGTVIDPFTRVKEKLDIFIKDDKIVFIGTEEEMDRYLSLEWKQKTITVLDAGGCVVAPGLMDVHVHFRDPGFTYKEDILSGARAALAGGFTRVVLMANTRPVVDNVETIQYVLKKGEQTKLHVETCAAVSRGFEGKELVDMALLKAHGAVGFTDDGIPLLDEEFVRAAMEAAVKVDMPLSFHEENPKYITNNGINHGEASEHFHIGGSDRQAEISMIKRDIRLAEETGAIIDIQHISTKEGVALVREAKKKYSNIHAEATPHHFSLDEEAAIKYGTLAKMNPPLRTQADKIAIIAGLSDGTIDMIATDHAPHSMEEKQKPVTEAPSGIIGLETALPLAVTNLVHKGYMELMDVLDRMIVGPARLYGMQPDTIEEEKKANLVIFNPDETFVYDHSNSKSENSPFLGERLYGKIHATIVDGEIVYTND